MAKRTRKPAVRKKKKLAADTAPASRHPTRVSAPTRTKTTRAEERVRIRMYRVGLGECFLLSFPRVGWPFHMLIDCGSFMRVPNFRSLLKDVVHDIHASTGGRLDVLVATHRHSDHLNGFLHEEETFRQMAIEQVWLGWTEDPNSPESRELARRRGDPFVGSSNPQGPNVRTMNVIRSLGGLMRYVRGGDGPVVLPGVPGARVFFLAPPAPNADLAVAVQGARSNIADAPFDAIYGSTFDQAREDPQFARYFRAIRDTDAAQLSAADEPEWRQIRAPPGERVPHLALDSMGAINDTSLVMAIELAARGESKVLLFPGDAMIASWWSWYEHRWPKDDPKGLTCADLLANTVLYKVSHKGAVSGTAMRFGLDMMNHPDLVALLSVDESVARRVGWKLPAPSVMTALTQKTHGRVIRADLGVPSVKRKPAELPEEKWQAFLQSTVSSSLYIDHYVEFPQLTLAERTLSESNWTTANERRVYLIDKKLTGSIRPEEAAELRELEKLFDEYLSTTAPAGLGLLTQLREDLDNSKRSGR